MACNTNSLFVFCSLFLLSTTVELISSSTSKFSASSVTGNNSTIIANSSSFNISVTPTATAIERATSMNNSSANTTTPIMTSFSDSSQITTSAAPSPTLTSTSGTSPITTLTSGTSPTTTSTSGTSPITTLTSGTSPTTTLTSETSPITTLTSGTSPITTLTSGTSPITTLTSGTSPTTTSTSETSPITTLTSGTSPITTSTSETSPITTSTSETSPITTLTSGTSPTPTSTSETSPTPTSTYGASPTTSSTAGVIQPSTSASTTTTSTTHTNGGTHPTPSITTTAATSMPPIEPKVLITRIEGKTKIEEKWDDALKKPNSQKYIEYEKKFKDAVVQIYEGKNVIVEVSVNGFVKGSIIVNYVITVKGVSDSDPTQLLIESIKKGKLGNLTVDAKHFEIKESYPGLNISTYETVYQSFLDNCCGPGLGRANQTRTCSPTSSNATCEGAVLHKIVQCGDLNLLRCSAASLRESIILTLGLVISRLLL